MGDSYCLKWNNHQDNLREILTKLLDERVFIDVTLVCETKTLKAHRAVLSASSPYFEQVLKENLHPHPIIIFKDVKEKEMSALLQYIYQGEVSVRDEDLPGFLHLAKDLKIKGLSQESERTENSKEKKELILKAEEFTSTSARTEIVTPPKRLKIKTNEQEELDVQSYPGPSYLRPINPPVPTASSDLGASTPSQIIKQELDCLVPGEESHLANLETRSDFSYRLGDWSVENRHSVESRNYPNQQVELPKVPLPMNINFSSQLQGPSMPGLYPCNAKGRPKKDQPSTSHDPKPKPDFPPGPSFSPNHPGSVIRNAEAPEAGAPGAGIPRKGGRFRPGWMENYSWLQYDECLNTMYCKTCRKWSSSVPDIRTSFVEGNGNFRLEIVNHHHKSKAHKLCMAKEEESIPRLDPIANEENH